MQISRRYVQAHSLLELTAVVTEQACVISELPDSCRSSTACVAGLQSPQQGVTFT